MPETRTRPFRSFALAPGRKVGPRYVVEAPLGNGTEGEVYQIRELDTGIVRAAKLYYPHRDLKKKLSIRHARKLNGLRDCPIVLQYHHSEIITIRREKVVAMISDLCEGQQLEKWIASQTGKRLRPYLALQVFYHLVRGLEDIHAMGQYHADVHSQNILVQPRGVRFEIKLIDFYDWGSPAAWKLKQDITDAMKVFYECLGGRPHYAKLPPEIRHICAGLKHSLVLKRFPTMSTLRKHLDTFRWAKMP